MAEEQTGDAQRVDVEAIKAEAAAAKAQAAKAEAELEKANKIVHDSRLYVNSMLEQIKARAAEGDAEAAGDFREKLEQDPEAAINSMFNKRVEPILQDYYATQAATLREMAKEKLKDKGWDEYEKEVEEFIAKLPPDVQARPDTYESAFNVIRSQHLEEIVEREMKKRLETEKKSQVEAATPPSSRQPAPKELSEDERKVAEAFGMSNDEYANVREEHIKAGGPWQRK